MLLKAHEVVTLDRAIKYLSRQCVKVHARGRRGFDVRLPQEYFDSIAAAMQQLRLRDTSCPRPQESWTNRGTSWPRAANAGSEQSFEVQSWSWKDAVHDH